MPERAPESNGTKPGRAALMERALREMRTFLSLFLYLWVLLGLFVLNQALVEREHGGTIAFQGFAMLNAFVLAKVMLVIEALELARWLRNRPVIIVIVYEAVICTFFFLAFHLVERLVMAKLRGHALVPGELGIGGGGFAGAAIVAVILFVSLLPFFAFKNVTRAIGADRMRQILFGRSMGANNSGP
ncbi:hypothetical protein [Xanthobacter versatilis]|uniref:hypothetical protein n=1 Tax=Xanthobacter autotrophicus (strain ATCC BAA-1158 / Py2) TaxID=78245 RepID=UPI00372812AF